MRPSGKKIFYDFRSNPSRSALVILSIFVGLFAVGMIMTLWICIPSDLRIGYERSNPANIYFRLSPFDNSLIRSVQNWDNVKDAMGMSVATLRAYDSEGTLKKIIVQAVSDDTWPVNHIDVLQGSWPLRDGEAAVENYKLGDLGVAVGQNITVKTASGKEVVLKAAASIRDQSLGAGDYSIVFIEPIQVYVHEDMLRKLEMDTQWNMLRIAIKEGGMDEAAVRGQANMYADRLKKAGYQVQSIAIRRTDAHPTADYADAIAGILLVIGILVLFLSGSLTYNTLAAILSNQMRQIGAMKTVGATYGQVVFMYMRLIFLYSLIALLLAVPASIGAAELCRNFLGQQINFANIRSGIIWETIAVQVVLGLIVPQIAGAIPVSKGARVSIQKAMGGMRGAGSGDNDRLTRSLSRLFSRPTALSMRNTFRNKKRLTLTLFTLSLGGAIFIASFNVNTAIDEHVAVIARYVQADLDLVTDRPYREDQIRTVLKDVSEIDYIEGWGFGSATFIDSDGNDGPSMSVFAPPDGSELISPNVKTGRWFDPGEQNVIALSERFSYTYPDIKVGDTITMEVKGTGVKTDWRVIGFFTMAGKSGGFLSYMPLSSWQRISGAGRSLTKFQIVTKNRLNDAQRAAITQEVEEILDRKGVKTTSIQRNDTFVADAARGLNIMSIFMMIMAVLVALVGCIGLTGTMSLNVMERTSEIGILRAIGASNRNVMKNVLTEGFLIGFMSWIIGSILSVPVGMLLTNSLGQAIFGSQLPLGFTPVGYVLWLVLSLVLSLIASGAPAKSAVNLTIREVLSVE
ncbi:MAG: FtsX-like permease family protein [Anaerolineaceae bacterium]|nr:FtsX-like permease family protein [Anaerolineaceae bacterium]